jgi:hypothetical protein
MSSLQVVQLSVSLRQGERNAEAIARLHVVIEMVRRGQQEQDASRRLGTLTGRVLQPDDSASQIFLPRLDEGGGSQVMSNVTAASAREYLIGRWLRQVEPAQTYPVPVSRPDRAHPVGTDRWQIDPESDCTYGFRIYLCINWVILPIVSLAFSLVSTDQDDIPSLWNATVAVCSYEILFAFTGTYAMLWNPHCWPWSHVKPRPRRRREIPRAGGLFGYLARLLPLVISGLSALTLAAIMTGVVTQSSPDDCYEEAEDCYGSDVEFLVSLILQWILM